MTKKRTRKKKDCGKTRSPSGATRKRKKKDAGGNEEGGSIPHASHMLQAKLCAGSIRAQAGLPERTSPESLSGTKVHEHLEQHFKEDTHEPTEGTTTST